jgi:hypothetical protein
MCSDYLGDQPKDALRNDLMQLYQHKADAVALGCSMIDYDTPRYPIREAAEATGFELNTLRTYFRRGFFKLTEGTDAMAAGKGLPHFLSLRTVMALAVAHRLWRRGADAWLAFRAGWDFANIGGQNDDGTARAPCKLYDRDKGFTVLLWFDAPPSRSCCCRTAVL